MYNRYMQLFPFLIHKKYLEKRDAFCLYIRIIYVQIYPFEMHNHQLRGY